MSKRVIVVFLLVIVIFIGCKKNEPQASVAIPLSSVLTQKSWKFSGEGLGNSNIWRSNDTCNADATYKFNTNYTYSFIGCDSSDAYEDSTSGHWAYLNSSQNAIVFHPHTTLADTFQVTVVASTILVFQQYQDSLGAIYSETFVVQ